MYIFNCLKVLFNILWKTLLKFLSRLKFKICHGRFHWTRNQLDTRPPAFEHNVSPEPHKSIKSKVWSDITGNGPKQSCKIIFWALGKKKISEKQNFFWLEIFYFFWIGNCLKRKMIISAHRQFFFSKWPPRPTRWAKIGENRPWPSFLHNKCTYQIWSW